MNSQVKRITARCGRAGKRLFLGKGRFLFLKKRNKRRCGIDDLSGKRCFPAHSAWSIKTDGSHLNRPFCVTRCRKPQEHGRETLPHLIFFCVVGLHGKAGAQARRTRAETRRRREAYPLWYSDRRQRRMCLRPSEGLRFPRKPTVFSSKKKRRRPSEGLRFPRKPIGFSF